MWTGLFAFAGWAFVPDFATSRLLQFAYATPAIQRVLRFTPSPPGSPTYRRHYGITFALATLGYLIYTLVDRARNTPPNFYEILGVPSDVDEAGLKLAFRTFARKNHPDRPEVGKAGEELFMHVREVLEALKNPVMRFAYNRFGPDALVWRQNAKLATKFEFVSWGLQASLGYHITSFLSLLFWSLIGRSSSFTFWRYTLFFVLLFAEITLVCSPDSDRDSNLLTLLHTLFPQRLIFQHVLFLHQLFVVLNVAVFRVAPYLIPVDDFADPRVQQKIMDTTSAMVAAVDRETSRIVHTDLQSIAHHPSPDPDVGFHPTPQHPSLALLEPVTASTATELLRELEPEVEQLILETNLKQRSGPLKAAWESAVRRAYEKGIEAAKSAMAEMGSRETTPTPDVVKIEEVTPAAGSGYFVVPSTPDTDRSTYKSVPRTPGELLSPRPSPSPPPGSPTPRLGSKSPQKRPTAIEDDEDRFLQQMVARRTES